MKRLLFLIYGLVAYVLTLGALTYLIGFSTTVLAPKHVDNGVVTPLVLAILINMGLVVLFGMQHSVMARPKFKEYLTRLVPEPLERSTYILVASLMTILLMWQWRPMPNVIWQVQNETLATLLYAIAVGGFLLVVFVTFLINHFDLFGLRQVVLYYLDQPYTPVQFKTPLLYKLVRHPMQSGVLIGIWVTPLMTAGHLLYAVTLTTYILIGLYYEERDLIQQFGERYYHYRQTTPKLFPGPGSSAGSASPKPVEREAHS